MAKEEMHDAGWAPWRDDSPKRDWREGDSESVEPMPTSEIAKSLGLDENATEEDITKELAERKRREQEAKAA